MSGPPPCPCTCSVSGSKFSGAAHPHPQPPPFQAQTEFGTVPILVSATPVHTHSQSKLQICLFYRLLLFIICVFVNFLLLVLWSSVYYVVSVPIFATVTAEDVTRTNFFQPSGNHSGWLGVLRIRGAFCAIWVCSPRHLCQPVPLQSNLERSPPG